MYPPYGGKPPSYGAPPNPGSRWPPSLPNRPPTDFANGPYGAPPQSFGSFPGAPTGPPGMAPPPGLGESMYFLTYCAVRFFMERMHYARYLVIN